MFSQASSAVQLNYLSFPFLTYLADNLCSPLVSCLTQQLEYDYGTKKYSCPNVTVPVKPDGAEFFLEDMKALVFGKDINFFKQFGIARQLLIMAMYNSITHEQKRFSADSNKNNNTILLKHALQIKLLVQEGISYLKQLEKMFIKTAFTDEFTKNLVDYPKYVNDKINYFLRVRELFIYEVIVPHEHIKNLRACSSKGMFTHAHISKMVLPASWIVSGTSGFLQESFDHINYESYVAFKTFLTVNNPHFGSYARGEKIYVLDARNPQEVFQQGINYHLLETNNGKKVNPYGSVVFFDSLPKARYVSGQHFESGNYDSVGGWLLNAEWTPDKKSKILGNLGGLEIPTLRPACR